MTPQNSPRAGCDAQARLRADGCSHHHCEHTPSSVSPPSASLSLRCLSVVGGSVTDLSFCPWCPLGSWGHVETPPPLPVSGAQAGARGLDDKVCCPDRGFPADREGSSFLPGLRSGASHCTFLWALGSDRVGEASLHCLPCARCGVICVASIHPAVCPCVVQCF